MGGKPRLSTREEFARDIRITANILQVSEEHVRNEFAKFWPNHPVIAEAMKAKVTNADPDDAQPRAWTKEEMLEKLVDHLRGLAHYWAHTLISDIHKDSVTSVGGEIPWRLGGLLHSILVLFDGCSSGMPAIDLVPSPHPDDEAFHKSEGENWWPTGVVINDSVHLHDMLFEGKKP